MVDPVQSDIVSEMWCLWSLIICLSIKISMLLTWYLMRIYNEQKEKQLGRCLTTKGNGSQINIFVHMLHSRLHRTLLKVTTIYTDLFTHASVILIVK